MADAVSSTVIYEDNKQYVVYLTNVSDGTGENKVVKVDKSAIGVAVGGAEATALDIERVDFAITGFSNVQLFWDHATDSAGPILTGSGTLDFTGGGGWMRNILRTSGLKDPKTADSTGDILLLVPAAITTGVYAITLWLSKRV